MTPDPLDVVVVMPAYRATATLDAALGSVAGQSRLPREVVVVDNGSDDETGAVAARWRDLLPLQVLRTERSGEIAEARRLAITSTDASLIALLDADDVWLPDHLATLTGLYQERGGIVCADALDWIPGRPLGRSRRGRSPVPAPGKQRLEILRENFVFIGALFSRRDYDAVGGFRDGFFGAEDWDLWIRMIRAGAIVHGATGPTVLYRLNPLGATRRAGIYDHYLAVLDAATDGCSTDEERAMIAARMRWLERRRSLATAFEHARAGRSAAARREARAALHAPLRIAVQAAGLAVAPVMTTRLGDRLRARWLG